jgi:hypothetical protein
MTELNNRTLSAVSLGVFIIALAIGFLAYMALDKGVLVILWVTALIFGVALCLMSSLFSDKTTGAGPSDRMYRLAVGAFVALVGLVGLIYTATTVDWIYVLVIFLIGIALIGITVALINNKKEASL